MSPTTMVTMSRMRMHRDCLILALFSALLTGVLATSGQQTQPSQVHSSAGVVAGPTHVGKSPLLLSSAGELLGATLEHGSGADFVELFDPLMDGRIRELVDRLRHKYPDSVVRKLLQLPARNFIQVADGLSGGRLSVLLYAYGVAPSSSRARRAPLDTMSGMSLGTAKRSSGLDPMSGLSFGSPSKRNFDEMDRSGFSGFAKRFSADFDEMDRSGFSGFAKRRAGDFDEMDRAGFSGFAKRFSDFDEIDRAGFSGFAKRFNFDELDRVGFNGFAKRSDLVSMLRTGAKGPTSGSGESKADVKN